MIEKITNLLRSNISVPEVLLCNYKDLKINEKDLIVLIYLMNQKSNQFNPAIISKDLHIKLPEVLEIVERLNTNDLLTIVTNKSNGVIEEVVELDNLYRKLSYLVVNEEEKENNNSIYDLIEKEFGRTLSPIEYDIVGGWLDEKYSNEIIECALKEAVFNGANNLKYMDSILYSWSKKGINTKEDVLKDKQNFKKKKESKKIEWIDYDYLNEDDN